MSAIDEVQALEQQRIRATLNKDIGALGEMLAADFVYIHSNAKKDNKDSFINALLSGATAYRKIETRVTDTRDFGETVLLIGEADLTVSLYGERKSFEVRFTTAYVRRGGEWQMALWQSTKAPA
jgi:ketosteroid isomerase-like protein